MGPDHQAFIQAVKLAAVALIAALLTATVVIALGKALLPAQATAQGVR